MTNVERALKPFAARMRLKRAVKWCCYGLLTGAAAALLIRLASYLWPFPTALRWCALAFAAMPALFAAVAWLCPLSDLHVARKVDTQGLQARAQTALMLKDLNTPMALLQRGDTVAKLESADPKQLLRIRAPRIALICAAGCVALFALSFFIANPQTELLQARAAYQAEMTREAELVDEGATKLDAADPQTPELRKLLGDLSRELRQSQSAKEALGAVNKAESGIQKLQTATASDARKALEKQGMSELLKALSQEDTEAAQKLLEQMSQSGDAAQLTSAAQNAAGATARAAMQSAASALASGNVAQALNQLQAALSGQSAASLQAMALSGMARGACLAAGVSGAGSLAGMGAAGQSGTGAGQGGSGAGTGAGAGLGSSDKDGGYGGTLQAGTYSGKSDPAKKVASYEPIYDPTRLNVEGTQTNERGQLGEGEVNQAEAGTGVGDASGQVPYNEVLQSYERQAIEAVQNASLPAYAQSWVEEYFRLLAE